MPSIQTASVPVTSFPNQFSSPYGNDIVVPLYSSVPLKSPVTGCLPCVVCGNSIVRSQVVTDSSNSLFGFSGSGGVGGSPTVQISPKGITVGVTSAYIGFTSATGLFDATHVVNGLKFTFANGKVIDYGSGFDYSFTYNGSAVLGPNGGAVLTPVQQGQAGSMFLSSPVNFRADAASPTANFGVQFNFTITPGDTVEVADGIVFVIQAVSDSVGGTGGGIGYQGISKSIGVKFDTFYNREYGTDIPENPLLEIPGYSIGVPPTPQVMTSNYIGLVENGDISHREDSYKRVYPYNNLLLADGNPTYAWVDYNNGSFSVYVSKSSTKPSAPIISNYHLPIDSTNVFAT